MKKRILAIICIMFLLFTITSPISGSIYSFADEPQQETLTQDQTIDAAIAAYLNARKAWIVNQTGDSIDTVQSVMESWINSYDFWTNHTNVGSIAVFYANCVIKYNPFRISLKGPAVRALNDLYNWLVDSGKLNNLDNSSGGTTSDNLYDGLLNGNYLYCNVYGNFLNPTASDVHGECTSVTMGNPWQGLSAEYLRNTYNTLNGTSVDYNSSDTTGYSRQTINIYPPKTSENDTSYLSDQSLTIFKTTAFEEYRPLLGNVTVGNTVNMFAEGKFYGNRGATIRGGYYMCIVHPSNNPSFSCFCIVTYSSATGKYYIVGKKKYNSTPYGAQTANVNLDTDDFDKTDPTPPEGDNEITYTPEDKTTGNTYNTYNEYITNYVKKNTTINKNYESGDGDDPEPEEPETPGGTTPPWTGNNSGTLTPDGNGGYDLSLPDLTLPDLDIDWSINGLKDKFPFSIPWDLMAFFTVLNAEPETPAIEAQIDLGIVNWDIDWDFHSFDSLAALLRNLEFIGFCLALILITRSIIKG